VCVCVCAAVRIYGFGAKKEIMFQHHLLGCSGVTAMEMFILAGNENATLFWREMLRFHRFGGKLERLY